ncbi:pilin [Marinobacter bohaiensis]|uniref:pilin n=1 Tax=Marinobacter bohaiensis TaxID=2201898 RepID=UPI000DAD9EB2|nr:pilin [Marinobacter bohaiensis]
MRSKHVGFSLLEIMIVVALIGILAAISIPLLQGYAARAQINRVVSELGVYRTAFESNLSSLTEVTNESLGYTPSELTTGSSAVEIAVINPDGTGHLQVTMGGNAQQNLSGLVIRFQRSSSGRWSCIIDKSAVPSWKESYKPAGCAVP